MASCFHFLRRSSRFRFRTHLDSRFLFSPPEFLRLALPPHSLWSKKKHSAPTFCCLFPPPNCPNCSHSWDISTSLRLTLTMPEVCRQNAEAKCSDSHKRKMGVNGPLLLGREQRSRGEMWTHFWCVHMFFWGWLSERCLPITPLKLSGWWVAAAVWLPPSWTPIRPSPHHQVVPAHRF